MSGLIIVIYKYIEKWVAKRNVVLL